MMAPWRRKGARTNLTIIMPPQDKRDDEKRLERIEAALEELKALIESNGKKIEKVLMEV